MIYVAIQIMSKGKCVYLYHRAGWYRVLYQYDLLITQLQYLLLLSKSLQATALHSCHDDLSGGLVVTWDMNGLYTKLTT